jgi:exodeoxyribonuclease VII small subunit
MSNEIEEKKIIKNSFEDNIQKAQKLLDKLIEPNLTLQDSVKVYKDGLKELELAQKLLDKAKLEYSELV